MLPADRNSTPLVRPLLIRWSSAPKIASAADADAEDQDAHVLDARVGQHALEVALPDHEDGRHRHRQQARRRPAARCAKARLARRRADLVDAQDAEEGAARERRPRAARPPRPAPRRRRPASRCASAPGPSSCRSRRTAARTPRAATAATAAARRATRSSNSSDDSQARRAAPSSRGRTSPSSASAMPTEPISRYFQVASSERGVVVEVDAAAPGQRRRLDRHPHQPEVLRQTSPASSSPRNDEQAWRRRRGSAARGGWRR